MRASPASCGWGSTRRRCPGWGTAFMVSRLPGQALAWRSCELRPRPVEREQKRWRQRWDPFGMCSWPPEDDRIESFHRHVRDQARAILGADLARVEKFTTSVRDGIDIRETLRNWHTGDLYVKVIPPGRGSIEVGGLPLRGAGRPAGLHASRHLVRRALRGIDAGVLRHRSHEEPGRARASPRPSMEELFSSSRPGRSPRSGPIPGSSSPTRSRNDCWPRPSCTAATGTSPWSALVRPGRPGGGWPGSTAGRSSTCRSSGSAASFSSGSGPSTCSMASRFAPTPPTTSATCRRPGSRPWRTTTLKDTRDDALALPCPHGRARSRVSKGTRDTPHRALRGTQVRCHDQDPHRLAAGSA